MSMHWKFPFGRLVSVLVSHVDEATGNVFLQINDEAGILESLMSEIEHTIQEESLKALRSEEITVGSIYLVQYQEDNVWYRARVLSYNAHKQECEVFFFDYGNTDFVPVSCMRVAKEKFCELPSQSFECELEGIHRFKEDRFGEVVATLNETILEQELFCKAVQLRKNCAVVVHLFVDDKGTDSVFDKIKARFATGTDSQIETNSLDTSSHRESILKREVKYDVIRLAVDSFHDLIVTWVEDPSHFWCQLLSKAEAFAELMEDIAAEYANLGPEALPLRSCTVGYPCCAKFYEDESWNRGIITNVSSIAAGQIEVRFVDFGNSQKTELKDVRDLKNEFLKFPCQAIYFTITGVDPNSKDGLWADEAKALFEKLIKDKHVVGLVVNVESDGRHKVKLIDTTTDLDMELNQVLIAAGYGVKSSGVTSTNTLPVKSPDSCPKTAPPPVFANESVEAGVEEKVLVTTIVNPSKFFCQLFRNGPKLENLMQDIGRHYSKLGTNEEILLSPSPGDPCCAQFSEDGCWYRAVVLSANSKGVAVQYIDYGNSETLPTVKIKKLIPKFSDLPKQAIECTLNRVKPRFVSGELKWRMCDTEMFKHLALEKAGQMTVVAEDNSGIKRMELVVRNKREAQNISEQLVISGNAMLADGALPASENWSNVITHTLPRPDVKVGHFEDAVVSYTENPGNFWCQLVKTSTELHSLMKEITIEYSKAAPRDSISKPSCGMLCCAQFTDDDAWYRGKITGIKKGGLVEVHFVDYGNYETLPLSRVKALKANYMKLPVQAIHCELAKLQVKSEALLSDNVMIRFEELTLDKELVIMADRYDEEHDTYAVVLFDTSEGKNLDIALELRSIAEPSRSHEATCIPSLDLQPGITEHVFVSFVASPRKFFCQLMKKADSLDELMGEMSEYYSSLADREGELAKPVTGEFCAAQFSLDDAWYRAQVLDVQGSHISVSYIDFGNSETLQLTRVKVLNTKFQNLPIQALECCFPKVPRGCTDAEFQELVAEKEFNACIVSVKSGVAEVDLLSKESKESLCDILIKGAINSEQLVPSTCRVTSVQWKIGDHVNVSIPFAESVQKFFCQATKHSNELNDLMNRMGEHYSVEQEHLSSVEIGSLYAAWYEEGGWYRAMVNHVQGESIDVFYIDYGDTATIALSGLRTLEDDFSLLPAQAVQCCLKGFSTNPEPAKFVEIAIEQEFEAQVVNVVNGVFEVELVSRDGLLSQMLVKEGEPPATSTCDVSSIQWNVGDKIQVFVPYVESAQKFFCQASPNVAELDGLMNRLEEHYSTSQATVTSISSGSFCVALYEEGGWYRARVNQVQSGTVEVFYIDYGDTATLPLNNIRTIEPEFSSLPAQAVQCCLRGFSVNGGPANFKDHVVEQEFEAQVISVKNGVFEIELFSDGDPVSQMLAKEMVPSVTPICNVSNIHWNVGDKIQVFIPYVESVHKFFCQPSKHTSELEKLMNRLEEHYSTSQATVTSISSRSFCVALYEEGGWYRARVNQVQSGTVEVFYIDYGDTATLPLNSIRTIEPEFSSLPAQAVQCCLKGFSVNGGPVNFKDHVIEQELEAQVISVKNGVFEIELFSDGEPVSQMLAKEMVPSVTPICNVSNIQWNVGDKIQVFIPYVESVHKFFCQPSKHTSELDELMNKLEEHYNTSQANVTSISLGSFCVALYEEGGWYRARVNQVQSGTVEVFYIDYGDTATLPLNSIRTIEPEFSSLPAQAVQCCLKGFSANGGPVNFKDLVIEQEFEAQVTHVKNSTIYEVELVTKESAFMSKKLIEERQPGASPLVGIKEGMYVDLCPTACISPHLFYCQIMTAEHKENLEQLMNQLQQHYDTINKQEGCISEPRIGMLCAAIFGGDGLWYRGKVSKVLDEQTVEVFYLDYGNCETVELGELKLLKEEWTSLAAEAVRCSMPLICPVSGTQWPNVTIDRFNYLTEHKQLVGKIMKLGRDSSLELELYDTTKDSSDINIGELLVKEGLACYSGSSKPVFVVKNVADLGQSKFSVKERVFVTAVETPECFYCQISGNESKLTALMDQIAAAYDSLADDELSFSFISPGNLCCAQFSEDSLWYRAALEGQTANSLTVRFIDYGNTETLPVNKVKILKDDFLCLPPLAIQCSLYGVKPAGSQYWVDEASVMFEELTSGKSLEATFMSSSVPKPFEVQLLDCGTDIADELVKSKLALLIERATKRAATTKEVVQDYRRPLVECGQIYDVYITYIASAGTFYCQLVNLSEQLDGMMNDLNNHYFQLAETEGCVVSPAIGQPCVALFEEMWYRAKVLHVSVNDVTVHYVDYGNTEAVKPSGVKQIVSPFLETPVTAVECSLDLGRESWSEEATSLLEKLTGSEIRTIKVVSQQKDRFEVKVFGDMAHCISDEVLQKLKETDEEQINKEEETLKVQYLEAGQAEKLYVVHTKNSEEFYVQLSKSYAELEKMMEDIALVYSGLSDDVRPEDLVVGTPCCALFAHDNCWYRAVITCIASDFEVEVHYVDYGNTAVVLLSDIRKLGRRFFSLPVQAICCCLDFTSNKFDSDQTSFQQQVDDKELLGQFLSLNGDKWKVRLFDHDKEIGQDPAGLYDAALEDEESLFEIREYIQHAIAPEEKHRVYVSHVVSPDEFYVQFELMLDDLALLGQEISQFYSILDPTSHVLRKPCPGMSCCAKFSEDSAWYRGRVNHVVPSGLNVKFIDYGNDELVSLKDVKDIDKNFIHLPQQAILCALDASKDLWTTEERAIFKSVTLDKSFDAKFITRDGQRWRISLGLDTVSVVDMFMTKDVTLFQQAGSDILGLQTRTFLPALVTPGQVEEVYMSHVTQSGEFYVQLSRTAPDLNTVENLLCELYEGEAVSRLAVEVCFADSLCCAKFSEDCKWYRALVTKVLSDSQVEVIFVDYGNSEIVTVESIKQLKPELLKYPVQSIKCRLDGSKDEWTAADVEEFEACVLDKPLHVMFTRKEDSSWFVTIKELDMFQAEPTNNKTKTFANETIQLNISEKAYFLSADSPECIWLQRTKTEAALSQVMGQIASEVTDEVLVKSQVVKGLACIGCFTEDDQWYRVQVLDVDSSVKVMYVDYGNTEWLPLDRLRSISDTAMLLPSQAIHCKLSGMQGIEPLKVINYLNDNLSDKVVEVKAESQCDDGSFSVVLYLPGNSQSVNEQIVVDCLGDTSPSQEAQQEQSSPSKPTTPEEIVDVGKSVNDCEVDVSLAKVLESSDDFSGEDQRLVWPQLEAGSHHNVYFMEAGDLEMVQLQLADSEAELSELMKQISIAYTSLGNEELALATPCVGQTCCAQYSEDGGWYRAVITAVSSEGVQVKFVDYGNTDLAVAIKQLKGEFLALPVQCVDCCLKRVVPAPEARKEDIALKLSELCESKLLTAEVTKVSGDSVEIDLFYDIEGAKHSVSESLINFGLAMHSLSQQLRQVSISDGKMVYNNPNLEVGCCYKVTVVCAESPSDFWCYLPETGAELESLSKKIALYYNSLGDNDMRVLCLQVGDVCCAQFSENGQWYRSQVTKLCSDSQVHVLSVDYAKQATLPLGRIKRLDAEFSVVPVQTFHCTLHHVEQPHKYYGEGWSKEAIARFQEMCAEMVITAEIVGVQGNLILVELFTFDNEMVSGKLLSEGLAVEVKPVLGSLPAKAIVNQLGSESSANKVEHCGMESPVNELDEDSVGKIILQDQARPQALKDTNQVDSGTVEKDGQEDDDDEEEFHDSSDQICTESFDCSGEQATMGDVSSDKPQEKEETKLEEDTIVNKALVPETEDQTEEINEIELKAEQGSSEVQKEAEASKTVTGGLSTEKIKHISSDEGIVCCDDISEAQEVKIVEESLDFLKEIIAGDKKLVEKEDQLSEEIQELVEGKIENCVSQEEPGAHVEEMEEQAQAVEWSKERSENIISQIEEKELEQEEVEEEVKDETSVETGVGAKGGESVQTRTEQIANVIESLETETEQDASGTDSCESGVEEVVAVESLESRIEEVVPVKPLESGIEEVVAVESPETGTQKEAEGSRSPEIRIEDSERIESIETGTEKDVEDVQRLETGTEKEVETIRSPETRIEDSERIESVETGTEKDVEDVQRLETGTEKEVETIRSPETRIEHSESIESVETGTEKEVEDVERLETVTEKDVEGILSLETGIEDVEVIESLDSKVEDLKVNGSLESEAQEEAKERRIIEREKGFQVNAEEKKFQAGEFEEDEEPVAEGFSEEDLTAIIEASNGTEEEEQCDEGRICKDNEKIEQISNHEVSARTFLEDLINEVCEVIDKH